MAQRAIREADGKSLLKRHIELDSDGAIAVTSRVASATVRFTGASASADSASAGGADASAAWVDFAAIESANPWVADGNLVVKPDQLIKRRGKGGLILLNASWEDARAWISERAGTRIVVDGIEGRLEQFIIEPFLSHSAADEYYVCIQALREGDEILFYHEVSREYAACVRRCDRESPTARLASPSRALCCLFAVLLGRAGWCGRW
jgi:ATP citrate (pro-S)-lyase